MYLIGFSPPATLTYMPYLSPGEIFRALREARGYSFREAAKAGHISPGSVQRLENGTLTDKTITGVVLQGAARYLLISEQTVLDILGGRYDDVENITTYLEALRHLEVSPDWVPVPVYGTASAGDSEAEPLFGYPPALASRAALIRKGANLTQIRAYIVNGDCMISEGARHTEKNLADGDVIIVDPSKGYEDGDTVVAWWPDEEKMVVKRFRFERENIRLAPARPGRPSVVLSHEDQLMIIGPVVWRGG